MQIDPDRHTRVRVALLTIGAFLLAYNLRLILFESDAFRSFYSAYPWQVGETVWKALWVAIALVALMLAHHTRLKGALYEVGLARRPTAALAAAAVAVAPMVVAFALLFPVNPERSALAVWMTGVVSPVSEEVLFRGFLFHQLHRRAGWPFLAAVLVSVAPFVWGHLHQAAGAGGGLGGVAAIVVVIGAGAAFFSWVLVRWDYNLWFPVGLHAFMNLAWYVFAVDSTAVGGWASNGARLLTLTLAVIVTLRRGKPARRSAAASTALTG